MSAEIPVTYTELAVTLGRVEEGVKNLNEKVDKMAEQSQVHSDTLTRHEVEIQVLKSSQPSKLPWPVVVTAVCAIAAIGLGIYNRLNPYGATMNNEIGLIPKTPAEVAKAIVYVALAVGALLINAGSGAFTLTLGLSIAILVLGLIPVYILTGTWVKAGVAFGLAALNALNVIFVGGVAGFGGVTRNEWITIGIQAFAAIGIVFIPNKAPNTPVTVTLTGGTDNLAKTVTAALTSSRKNGSLPTN